MWSAEILFGFESSSARKDLAKAISVVILLVLVYLSPPLEVATGVREVGA